MARLSALVLVGVLLVSCFAGPTVRETAEGYLTALAQVDFDAASRYVADEGRANFNALKAVYASLKPEEQKKFAVTGWKVTGESVHGDAATVDFVFDRVKRGQLSLKRTLGGWKVDQRKTF